MPRKSDFSFPRVSSAALHYARPSGASEDVDGGGRGGGTATRALSEKFALLFLDNSQGEFATLAPIRN